MELLSTVIFLAPILLVSMLIFVVFHQASWWWLRSCNGIQQPPGSVGFLPLLGETLRLIAAYKTENPEPFMDSRIARHGRVFTSHIFGERTVFSADPELNRAILAGEGKSFTCSYPSSIVTLLGPHSLLLTPVGPRHRKFHLLILARFGSAAALRDSPYLMRDIDRLVKSSMAAWEEGRPVRLLEQAKKITFELTVKQLMSEGPGEWMEELRRHYLLVIDGFFSIALPAFVPGTTYARALKAREAVAEALRGMVRRRKERGRAEDGEKDMIDELLAAAEEGLVSSEEEMVDFLVSLLVAGYETTSTIMTLAVKFLTDTPAALALLRAEQEEIQARKNDQSEPLDWKDYKSMPFTQCVINETLRVANVVSGVFRRAVTDVQFKGYTIPKGCKVFASFRAVHMDPDYYKDARTFNPWRWQEKDAPQQTGGTGGIFTPFGGGPRWCPGAELSRVQISIFLHYLVTYFSWDEAEKDRLLFFPTTRTLKGYPINIRRRRRHNRFGATVGASECFRN